MSPLLSVSGQVHSLSQADVAFLQIFHDVISPPFPLSSSRPSPCDVAVHHPSWQPPFTHSCDMAKPTESFFFWILSFSVTSCCSLFRMSSFLILCSLVILKIFLNQFISATSILCSSSFLRVQHSFVSLIMFVVDKLAL